MQIISMLAVMIAGLFLFVVTMLVRAMRGAQAQPAATVRLPIQHAGARSETVHVPSLRHLTSLWRARDKARTRRDLWGVAALFALVLVAVLFRVDAAPRDGNGDIDYFFRPWSSACVRDTPWAIYKFTDVNYPPLSLYFYTAVSKPYLALGETLERYYYPPAWAIIKAPAIIFDALLMIAGYWFVWRFAGVSPGLIVAGLLAANPVIFFVSSVWGQIDVILSVFLALSLMALHYRRVKLAWILFALAFLTKFQAVVLLPLLVIYTVWPRIDADNQQHYLFGSLAGWRNLSKGIWRAVLTFAFVMAPFVFVSGLKAFRGYEQIDGYPIITMGAYNFWFWATNLKDIPPERGSMSGDPVFYDDWNYPGFPVNAKVIGIVMLAGVTAMYLVRGITQPHNRNDFLLAGCLYIAFFVLPTQIHERYIFPAIPLLTLAIYRPMGGGKFRVDWRAVFLLAGFTFTAFYNIAHIHRPYTQLNEALWKLSPDGLPGMLNLTLVLFFLSVGFALWPDRAGLRVHLVTTTSHLRDEFALQIGRLRQKIAEFSQGRPGTDSGTPPAS